MHSAMLPSTKGMSCHAMRAPAPAKGLFGAASNVNKPRNASWRRARQARSLQLAVHAAAQPEQAPQQPEQSSSGRSSDLPFFKATAAGALLAQAPLFLFFGGGGGSTGGSGGGGGGGGGSSGRVQEIFSLAEDEEEEGAQ
jgi:hypothetical protein